MHSQPKLPLPAPTARGTIKIGAVGPLTGPNAEDGKYVVKCDYGYFD